MFNMLYFDNTFSTKSISQESSFNQLTTMNGFIIPKNMVEKHAEERVEDHSKKGALQEWEIGPLLVEEFEIDCIQLDQELKIHEMYGILVECRQNKEKVFIPLAEIDVDEENGNYKLVSDYQEWFWNYR